MTKEVLQFRDGECEVRYLWDAAELSRLRHLFHQEPHVRVLGYGQYADDAEEEQKWDGAGGETDT